MLHAEYWEEHGVLYVHASPPFDLDRFFDFLDDRVMADAPEETSGRGALLDLRDVNLLDQSTANLKTFIMRRLERHRDTVRLPCAVLVRESGSFGMVRMFSILASLADLRAEDSLFPTLEIDEAAAWLADRIGLPDQDPLENLIRDAHSRARAAGPDTNQKA